MNKEIKWLTVLDIEKATKIPNATVRRYIRNHGHHLNIKKNGKSYLIAEESIQIIKDIRNFYEVGKSIEYVENTLANMGTTVTISVSEDEKHMNINIGEALEALRNDFNQRMNEQNDIIQSLLEKINQQQKYIDKLEERDKQLITAIYESQETKKMLATGQQKKWWEFWK